MTCPKKGDGLQKFVCAVQWMPFSIPKFSSIIRPLSAFLEDVYSKAGKRTLLASEKVSLESISWEQAHENASMRGIQQLRLY